LVLENDTSLVSALVSYLGQIVGGMPFFGPAAHLRICTAIEEAVLNALYHGNLEVDSNLRQDDDRAYEELAARRRHESLYQDRRIHVRSDVSESGAVYVIRDEGPGFDPSTLPDPRDPANLLRPFGRGVLLMRTFMDDVEFNEHGNEVTLVKRPSTTDALSNGNSISPIA
jgi:hypothetical protein